VGSSYLSSLSSGRLPEDEAKLREAVRLVREVMDEWIALDHDQFDDAAEDGGFVADLGHAIRFIEDNLPNPERNTAYYLKTALRTIEQRGLAVGRNAVGADESMRWWVSNGSVQGFGPTIPDALAAHERLLTQVGR